MREGLIRHNRSRDVDLRHRLTAEGSEGEEVQALSRDELATLLDLDWLGALAPAWCCSTGRIQA
jgi:hypothetical protein